MFCRQRVDHRYRHCDGGQFDIIGHRRLARGADLGQAGTGWLPVDDLGADARLRRSCFEPVKNGLVDGHGALRRAVLCRELVHLHRGRPVSVTAGVKMPGSPTHDQIAGLRGQAHGQVQAAIWHLPARQAGLGREHGVHRPDGEYLWRTLVQRWTGSRSSPRSRGRRRSPTTSRTDAGIRPSGCHRQRA